MKYLLIRRGQWVIEFNGDEYHVRNTYLDYRHLRTIDRAIAIRMLDALTE